MVLYIYLFFLIFVFFGVINVFTGGCLKNFIKQCGPFRDKDIVNYTFQLLFGVKYLHEKNILHRDIKGIFNYL